MWATEVDVTIEERNHNPMELMADKGQCLDTIIVEQGLRLAVSLTGVRIQSGELEYVEMKFFRDSKGDRLPALQYLWIMHLWLALGSDFR